MANKAFIFSAPSGSGKTTIVRHLLNVNNKLSFSISATTRAPRGTEVHGKDYYFLTDAEFDQKVKEGAFLEWEEVYKGTRYGTLNEEIQRIWESGKSVIFDVDVVGGINLKKKLGDAALAVFVRVPDLETLRNRLTHRNTDSLESLEKRIGKSIEEMGFESEFDVSLINDQLEETFLNAEALITDFLNK